VYVREVDAQAADATILQHLLFFFCISIGLEKIIFYIEETQFCRNAPADDEEFAFALTHFFMHIA